MTDEQIELPGIVPDDPSELDGAAGTDNGYPPGKKDPDTEWQGWSTMMTADEVCAEAAIPQEEHNG